MTRRAALLLSLALAACGGEDAEPGRATPAPATSSGEAAPQTRAPDTLPAPAAGVDTPPPAPAAPPFTGTTGPTRGGADPERVGVATLVRLEVAGHPGFDRVVFQFDGAVLPRYTVEYLDGPVIQCGSGDPVEVAGAAHLEVRFVGAQAHDDAGRPTVRNRRTAPGLPALRESVLVCDFEGHVELALGLSARQPYRVLELSSPTRLVVDVSHPR